jgi:isoleucyl-tRNA synthetase
LLAPFTPFVADELYENLDGSLASVHLADFPVAGARDVELEEAMAVARETVRLGLAARGHAKVKLRQPLHAAVVVAAGVERERIERLAETVRDELNVRELRFVSEADELGEAEIKANYRTLGPRFGKDMPRVAAAVAGLDGRHVSETLRAGGLVGVNVAGDEHQLSAEDLLISMKPLDGYLVEREGQHGVALELEITDSLRIEGWAREIVHAVQGARRGAELDISDRIKLVLDGSPELLAAAREHEAYLTGETLAVSISYEPLNGVAGAVAVIDGLDLRIAVVRV